MVCIERPYLHFIKDNFFEKEKFSLLRKFVLNASWEFFQDANFPQFVVERKLVEEFFLSNPLGKKEFEFLFSSDFARDLGKLFSLELVKCVSISFHKLTPGCFNSVHNDSNQMGEQLRVICYLSHPGEYEGGELNLFSLSDQEKASVSYKLNPNTAFIFAMREESVHSVSKIRSGKRICLVLTFS